MQCCASKKSFFRIRIYIIFRIRNTSKVEDERQITSFAAVKILNFFTYRYLSVIGFLCFFKYLDPNPYTNSDPAKKIEFIQIRIRNTLQVTLNPDPH
jgi:hypothetical protein